MRLPQRMRFRLMADYRVLPKAAEGMIGQTFPMKLDGDEVDTVEVVDAAPHPDGGVIVEVESHLSRIDAARAARSVRHRL